jgi:hypothetical protein
VTDHSSNGVWIDGAKLTRRQPVLVSPGSVIGLVRSRECRVAYRFLSASPVDTTVDPPPPTPKRRRSGSTSSSPSAIIASRSVEDDYELGKELGRGGYAVVFAAHRRSTGKKVAIKRIEKAAMDAEASRKMQARRK